jgi:hypothetical protein
MDHVVYLDAKANELEKILSGTKTMIIRGATGRKMPYGRVDESDVLFLLENDGSGEVKAKVQVVSVINSDKLDPEESAQLVDLNQPKLNLSADQIKRWSGKRYLVLIEIDRVECVEPFRIDKSAYSTMDDWLPVENIDTVK